MNEEERFIAYYGEVLCPECSQGVEPCTNIFSFLFDMPSDLNGVYFYLQKVDLSIKSEVTSIEHNREEIYIKFNAGSLSICENSMIKKVKKPSKVKGKFEFCYMIKNRDAETLGFIGKEQIQ
ncbi:MAG: hypothetical protein Q8936_06430 [Bacillota bacterium]|nr:hypothetical protein [Bacillota bacterium]